MFGTGYRLVRRSDRNDYSIHVGQRMSLKENVPGEFQRLEPTQLEGIAAAL